MPNEVLQHELRDADSYPAAACFTTAFVIAALLGAIVCAVLRQLGAEAIVIAHKQSIFIASFLIGLGCAIPFFDHLATSRQPPTSHAAKKASGTERNDSTFRGGLHSPMR